MCREMQTSSSRHILPAVQDLFMVPMTDALGDTEKTPWPCSCPVLTTQSWEVLTAGHFHPQHTSSWRRCSDCSCLPCSCTCLPRSPPSPRRGCLISRLAAFNPSSSVPGWELKTCNKQIEVYDIIIANISALFSSQGGEFWNERRSEACQCVKFYGLMSQNCSTSQLGATPVLWMLLKTKANST